MFGAGSHQPVHRQPTTKKQPINEWSSLSLYDDDDHTHSESAASPTIENGKETKKESSTRKRKA